MATIVSSSASLVAHRPPRNAGVPRRDQRFLAPVLRQGVRSLPAGTALHARSRSGLARQACGGIACGSVDGRRNPVRQGLQQGFRQGFRSGEPPLAGNSCVFCGRPRLHPQGLRATIGHPRRRPDQGRLHWLHRMSSMTRMRCAILDDYLNLSLKVADWSKVEDRVDITVFNQPFVSQDSAVSALKDFEIIWRCASARRFRARCSHLAEAETPDHLGHAQRLDRPGGRKGPAGRRVRDEMAARSDRAATMGMILELTRNIGRENARDACRRYLQKCRHRIDGQTLGVVGLGKLGGKVSAMAKRSA